MNVILRPVYNRPEMLRLSMEYEIAARNAFEDLNLITLFLVENGADEEVVKLVNSYPYESIIIPRKVKQGLSTNVLEGMKVAFRIADNYIIHLEDDVLLHRTYFQYLDAALRIPEIHPFSIISPYIAKETDDVNGIVKGHFYSALAPLIDKRFFNEFVRGHANKEYYTNRAEYIKKLDARYVNEENYKYKVPAHNEQAGLINRLVDVALIDKGMYTILPKVNRQQHIGFFGKNRPGGFIPGGNYEERLRNLREIIKDPVKMYDLSATKEYNDYKAFNPKLEEWDGTLHLRGIGHV